MLKVRIVYVDYYLNKPTPGLDETYAEFRGEVIKKVPIVRIFGVTEDGSKVCLHVHNVYPYFCIPIDDYDPCDQSCLEKESIYTKKLMRELDFKITQENKLERPETTASPPNKRLKSFHVDQIVHKIIPFDAYKMYGYNETMSHFYKICLYNPRHVMKASEMFSSGFIQSFPGKVQSYQNHVPFILQFFIDYNLYGMNFIHLKKCFSRHSGSTEDLSFNLSPVVCPSPMNLKKMSSCSYEFDCRTCDIAIQPGTGTDLIWWEEEERCNQMNKPFNLAPSFSQDRPKAVGQLFKREADFLSVLDRALAANRDSNTSTTVDPQSNTQIEEDFNLICRELMLANQLEDESVMNGSQLNPLPGPSCVPSSRRPSSQGARADVSMKPAREADASSSEEEWDGALDDQDFADMVHSLSQLVPSSALTEEFVPSVPPTQSSEPNQVSQSATSGRRSSEDLSWAVEPIPEEELQQLLNMSNDELKSSMRRNTNNILQLDGNYDSSSAKSSKKKSSSVKDQDASKDEPKSSRDKTGRESRFKDIESLLPLRELKGREKVRFLLNLLPNAIPEDVPVEPIASTSKNNDFLLPRNLQDSFNCRLQDENNVSREPSVKDSEVDTVASFSRKLGDSTISRDNSLKDVEIPSASNSQNEEVNDDQVDDNVDEKNRSHLFISGPFEEDSHVSRLSNIDDIELHSCYGYDETINNLSETETQLEDNVLNENGDPAQHPDERVIIETEDGKKVTKKLVEGALSKMRRLAREKARSKRRLRTRSNSLDLTSDDDLQDTGRTTSSPSSVGTVTRGSQVTSLQLHSTPRMRRKKILPSSSPVESPILPSTLVTSSGLKAIPEDGVIVSPVKRRNPNKKHRSLFSGPKLKCTLYSSEKYLSLKERGLLPNIKSSAIEKPRHRRRLSDTSILSGPTLTSQEEFIHTGNSGNNNAILNITSPHEFQYVTLMSVEIFAESRGSLLPDPAVDPIKAIFYSVHIDEPTVNSATELITTGILITRPSDDKISTPLPTENGASTSQPLSESSDSLSGENTGPFSYFDENVKITLVNTEMEMIFKFIDVIRAIDPDYLIGFENEKHSWGYIVSRSAYLNIRISTSISRLIDEADFKRASNTRELDTDPPDGVHINAFSLLQFPGRILLDCWHTMRHEIILESYTFENVYFHILHQRISKFSNETLSKWYNQALIKTATSNNLSVRGHEPMWRLFEYFITRCEGNLKLLLELNFIGRHSTLARVYGIQFSDNISRGSQYRVESIMLRLAKISNMIPVSITPKERSDMKAVEFIPFVMEPESNYYTDPVVVLDFQSLYPSMMIAYNYCFTTCLGRVSALSTSINENNGKGKPFEFGASTLVVPKEILTKYRDSLTVSPNGAVFVKDNIRRGIVPDMLQNLIKTRIMVKNAMKENMGPNGLKSKSLQRILESRQKALKMVANTTYGYIGATITGRMPCVEIADAIVSKGKEALKRAIDMVHSHPRWNAKCIYGDTDSLFIILPGRSRAEAFKIGNEIADAVTDENPQPVKLKFEKVYHPCVLQTKKRYVGYSWETLDQKVPKFDAKGIETVRRDQIPATSKLLEKSLRLLFESNDIQVVKKYVCRQFSKMDAGSLGLIQDFIFAKEYRGKEFYSAVSKVPCMEIIKRNLETDRRAEPRRRTRVPYVIISGSPEQPLYQLVRSPIELITNPSLKLNIPYYIERVIIPALNRVFTLMGQDVNDWRAQMPKRRGFKCATLTHTRSKKGFNNNAQSTLSQYFLVSNCPVCYGRANQPQSLCDDCQSVPQASAARLLDKIKKSELLDTITFKRCYECSKNINVDSDICVSVECENLFRRVRANANAANRSLYHKLLDSF